MQFLRDYFDKDITGITFIVIGKKYSGFSVALEKNIISSIVDEYNKKFKNRFDVMFWGK